MPCPFAGRPPARSPADAQNGAAAPGDSALVDFALALPGLRSVREVTAALVAHSAPMGFPTFAIGGLPHPDSLFPEGFIVDNWPEAWHVAYRERAFGLRDPSVRALLERGAPFTIGELRRGWPGFDLRPDEAEVLDFAASIGRPAGLVSPVFGPQGYRGIVCFAGPGADPDPVQRVKLLFLGQQAHDRLFELTAEERRAGGGAAGGVSAGEALSAREAEVMGLARKGLTDARIAATLGISVRTVRFHCDNVRRKTGARTRAEAVAQLVNAHLLPP